MSVNRLNLYMRFEVNQFRGLSGKSNFTAWYNSLQVYSSQELDRYVEAKGLAPAIEQGGLILVTLIELGARRRYYKAVPPPVGIEIVGQPLMPAFLSKDSSVPVEQTPEFRQLLDDRVREIQGQARAEVARLVQEQTNDALTNLNQDRRVAVLIDSQNFLASARNLGIHTPVATVQLIRKILIRHRAVVAKFYVCWPAEIDGYVITSQMRAQLQALEDSSGVMIVSRPMKVITGNRVSSLPRRKVDIDAWLIPDLVSLYTEMPGLDGVVLVSGDSDYVPALEATWLNADRGGSKYVEVISTEASIARELVNDSRISKVFLEHLL